MGPTHAILVEALALDQAISARGIQSAPEKDVNDQLNATVIGIDVCDGRYLCPSAKKLALIMSASTFVFSHRKPMKVAEQRSDRRLGHEQRHGQEVHVPLLHGFQPTDRRLGHEHCHDHETHVPHEGFIDVKDGTLLLSPLELSAILGSLTHFAMLNRPTLSSFYEVYNFSRALTGERERVPLKVTFELGTFLALAPLLEADLRRPWQDVLVATDASQAYGYGVSVAPLEPEVVKSIGRVGKRPNQFVRLKRDLGPSDEPERPRKGTPHTVPLAKSAFQTVVMSKARFKAHSSTPETGGVALGLRWLLRDPRRHARRTVFLVDAQAVLGAVTKGRSSAQRIRRDVANVSALCLAGDLLMRYVYVPSEDNPADEPSRGIWRKLRLRKSAVKRGKTGIMSKRKRDMAGDLERERQTHREIKRLTHQDTIASINAFRRGFRMYEWSDLSSLSSLDECSDP